VERGHGGDENYIACRVRRSTERPVDPALRKHGQKGSQSVPVSKTPKKSAHACSPSRLLAASHDLAGKGILKPHDGVSARQTLPLEIVAPLRWGRCADRHNAHR
jgi:hypothetical protein